MVPCNTRQCKIRLTSTCSTIVKRIEPIAGTAVLIITGELFLSNDQHPCVFASDLTIHDTELVHSCVSMQMVGREAKLKEYLPHEKVYTAKPCLK